MDHQRLVDAILRAVKDSGRSDRSVSSAALGQSSAVASLRRGTDPRLSSAVALCRELGLELYIAAPRGVPAEIARALGLRRDCRIEDAVAAIERSDQWHVDAMDALRAETESQLDLFRRETARHWREILQEYRSANPEHLGDAPFHAVPLVTEVAPTGNPGEVALALSPVGRSFTRPQVEGWAEWGRLVCMPDPASPDDLVVVETAGAATREAGRLLLDVSNPELEPGGGFTYLVLSASGLGRRRLDDARKAMTSDQFHMLSAGDWVVGKVAATAKLSDHNM